MRLALALVLTLLQPAHAADPSPTDPMAQRMQACAACHGREGRAGSDGYYPRIAGKPQAYLYRQLLNFRERRRGYAPMTHMVKLLSDDYLNEMAAYFAQLDLPYPAPQTGATTPQGLALGAALVRQGDAARGIPACVSCHGEALTGVLPAVPGLLGLPRDYINAQLGAWATGLRTAPEPDCMARVVAPLSAQDVAALSMWLASQPVPLQAKAAPAPQSAGVGTVPCGGLPAARATAR